MYEYSVVYLNCEKPFYNYNIDAYSTNDIYILFKACLRLIYDIRLQEIYCSSIYSLKNQQKSQKTNIFLIYLLSI